ncbi:hypothetical protein EGW08_012488 [Elysia chlorotica]|uniref:Uncharacterized protein n=1 Tax=Elysia chlorotica TaxID=188477 RepID=A0A433TE06_ELYCH|nr:hypothetical protein EGW08_012488 [Elysia chlorotica]
MAKYARLYPYSRSHETDTDLTIRERNRQDSNPDLLRRKPMFYPRITAPSVSVRRAECFGVIIRRLKIETHPISTMSSSICDENKNPSDDDHIPLGVPLEALTHHPSCDRHIYPTGERGRQIGRHPSQSDLVLDSPRDPSSCGSCPYQHNPSGCQGNAEQHKLCCIGWRRCEIPDSNLRGVGVVAVSRDDMYFTHRSVEKEEIHGAKEWISDDSTEIPEKFTCASMKYPRGISLSEKSEAFINNYHNNSPSFGVIVCSCRWNSLHVGEILSENQRCECCSSFELPSNGEILLSTVPENYTNLPGKRKLVLSEEDHTAYHHHHLHNHQNHNNHHHYRNSSLQELIDSSLDFVKHTGESWVDLKMSSTRCRSNSATQSGTHKACQRFPDFMSWARTVLMYVLVLSIFAQSCCEGRVLQGDTDRLDLSKGSALKSKREGEGLVLPLVHIYNDRRRRSSDNSSPAAAASSSSTPSSSDPSSSDIPRAKISPSLPTSPEFIIPDKLSQSELLALLASTLQKLNLLHPKNTSSASSSSSSTSTPIPRCFRIRKEPRRPAGQDEYSTQPNKSSVAQDGSEVNLVVEEFFPLLTTADGNATAKISGTSGTSGTNSINGSTGGQDFQERFGDDVVCLNDTPVVIELRGERKTPGGSDKTTPPPPSIKNNPIKERVIGSE